MANKTISPAQAEINKALLKLEKKKIKNGKELKNTLGQVKLQSGMRRFNRGGKV